MLITDLRHHNIPLAAIKAWEKQGRRELFPVQNLAFGSTGVLKRRNLAIFSPTGSGKTFIVEVVTVLHHEHGLRTIFLVPTRALAEEQYFYLTNVLGPLGLRVVIATSEHRKDEWNITCGRYDVAVMVYEKMKAFLWSTPGFLDQVGCVFIDELQILCDRERSGCVNLVLRELLNAESPPQIITASGVLEKDDRFVEYLRADVVETNERPVELHKGVSNPGSCAFTFRENNSGIEGEEHFEWIEDPEAPPLDSKDRILPSLLNFVRHFAQRNEQTLVFVPTQGHTQRYAQHITNILPDAPAKKALAVLKKLPSGRNRDELQKSLQKGVAFHHSSISRSMRRLIEQGVNDGEIRFVVATSTLAQGVNLKVTNVLCHYQTYGTRSDGTNGYTTLTFELFENMAGRAGRPGHGIPFGRAIILAPDEEEYKRLVRLFFNALKCKFDDRYSAPMLERMVLDLIAGERANSENTLRSVLEQTWLLRIQPAHEVPSLWRLVTTIIESLEKYGLITRTADLLSATPVGRAVCLHGVAAGTGIQLAKWSTEWAKRIADDPRESPNDMELLTLLTCMEELRQKSGSRKKATETVDTSYYKVKFDWTLENSAEPLRTWLSGTTRLANEINSDLRKAEIAYYWSTDMPLADLEDKYDQADGFLQNLGGTMGRLALAHAEIAECAGLPVNVVDRIRAFALRLPSGLPAGAQELGKIYRPELSREQLLELCRIGLTTIAKLADAEPEKLPKAIPLDAAKLLVSTAAELQSAAAERAQTAQIPKSASLAAPPLLEPVSSITGDTNNGKTPYLRINRSENKCIWIEGKIVKLRGHGRLLLEILAEKPGQVFRYIDLGFKLWGKDSKEEQQIRLYVKNIRKALAPHIGEQAAEHLVLLHHGLGFSLQLTPAQVIVEK